jgi:hypothetical protein
MVVQIKASIKDIICKLELDLEHQPQLGFQSFTNLRTSLSCLTLNKRRKLRQHLW